MRLPAIFFMVLFVAVYGATVAVTIHRAWQERRFGFWKNLRRAVGEAKTEAGGASGMVDDR